jgi:hypothetical protein
MKVTKRFGGDYDYPIGGFVLSHDEKKLAIQFQDNSLFLYSLDTTTSIDSPNTLDVRSSQISPNPATDFIEISYPPLERGAGGVIIKIYNVFGQIQTTPSLRDTPPWKGGEKVRIDVSLLPAGIYFVRIGDKVQKFIKL